MEWKIEHAIVYPTVDCAIFTDGTYTKIYLARKPGQSKWRFVGGFVDPSDESYQSAALREAKEETNLDCRIDSFITSAKVCDPRYENKEDKIMTTLFSMFPQSDIQATAMDDIAELRVFQFSSLNEDLFVPEHKILYRTLRKWLDNIEREFRGC